MAMRAARHLGLASRAARNVSNGGPMPGASSSRGQSFDRLCIAPAGEGDWKSAHLLDVRNWIVLNANQMVCEYAVKPTPRMRSACHSASTGPANSCRGRRRRRVRASRVWPSVRLRRRRQIAASSNYLTHQIRGLSWRLVGRIRRLLRAAALPRGRGAVARRTGLRSASSACRNAVPSCAATAPGHQHVHDVAAGRKPSVPVNLPGRVGSGPFGAHTRAKGPCRATFSCAVITHNG